MRDIFSESPRKGACPWCTPNQAATTVARCLADRTGGRYVRAETVDELIGALRVTLGCNVLGALPVQGRRLQ